MKKFTRLVTVAAVLVANVSLAGECGTGKVMAAMDGGWDQNSFFIKLDNVSISQHPNTYWADGWIRFESSRLESMRYAGIKSMAIAALTAGKVVRVYTHTNRCDSATEFTLYP